MECEENILVPYFPLLKSVSFIINTVYHGLRHEIPIIRHHVQGSPYMGDKYNDF